MDRDNYIMLLLVVVVFYDCNIHLNQKCDDVKNMHVKIIEIWQENTLII